MSDHLLSHSNSFGFEMEIDTAGCRAYDRNFIVGGDKIMPEILTIRQCVRRAKGDGLQVSEGALRHWVSARAFPVLYIGNRAQIYYPHLVEFLTCGAA